ncbi:hypothetical protein ScPMuIL_004796 [Solemya velum]
MIFSNLFRGWDMLAIDIKLVLLVLVVVAPSYGVGLQHYPKKCNGKYTKCLRGGVSSSIECGTERVICLLKYCTEHITNTGKHQKNSAGEIKRSIAKCLLK